MIFRDHDKFAARTLKSERSQFGQRSSDCAGKNAYLRILGAYNFGDRIQPAIRNDDFVRR